ncbi:MAG: VCBS repeat-containing protein [Acidobacteriaceae bacterium]
MLHRSLAAVLLLGTAVTISAQSNVSFETYNDPVKTAAGSIVAGDFNNDGKPDLVECCNASTQMVFRAGNGEGRFAAPSVAFATPVSLESPVAVDVNGDGNLDIVAVAALNPPQPPGEGNYELMVFLGNGNGTFQAPKVYKTTQMPNTVVVGNIFGDGHPDIAVADEASTIDLFRNDGNGTFTYEKSINMGGGPYAEMSVAGGDINGNGYLDLAVMQLAGTSSGINGADPQELYVLWNDGKGDYTQQEIGDNYYFPEIAVSRLNGDAQMDILVSYQCTANNGDYYCIGFDGYYGQGNDKVVKKTLVTDSSGVNPGDIGRIAGVDVNGDGYGDIVAVGGLKCDTANGTCNPGTAGLFTWVGNANGTFQQTSQQIITSDGQWSGSVTMADFNRDGMMDFAQGVPGAGGQTEVYINSTKRTTCGRYTISPSITVCEPVDNTYAPNPVRVEANAYDTTSMTAMQEYIDNKLVYSEPVTSFDTTFSVSNGPHFFVTKGWDTSGRSFVADRNVTAYSGTPGPVCTAAPDSASICLPAGDTSSSPVLILANGDTGSSVPTAAQLYIDGKLVVDNKASCSDSQCWNTTSFVQVSENLASGSHDLVFKIWDVAGKVYEASKTVTVN